MIENLKEKALKLHKDNHGKIRMESKVEVKNQDDLSLAYSPGVAEPCLEIKKDPDLIYDYTSKGNLVAVITDGSAVLGLGNIGDKASLPVMEGKSILLKTFAGIDSFPICIKTQDPDEIVNIVKNIGASFGAINLEDINAPKCIEIEQRLQKEMDIPVFHDDQHGTAIVCGAALLNALKVSGKKIKDVVVAQSGTGAAGLNIIKMFKKLGVKEIRAYNINGVVNQDTVAKNDKYVNQALSEGVIKGIEGSGLGDIVKGADVFVGVSVADILSAEMVKTMNEKAIIFAMANPNPEIKPELAREAGAYIIGTGRSDYPNQINNVLAFPGIFRGALDARVSQITEEMKLAATHAIANCIDEKDLTPDYIIPNPFDKKVAKAVAQAVMDSAK